jgi:hypothetical protein
MLEGCTVPQAVTRRSVNMEAWVPSWANPREIFCGQGVTGTGFPVSAWVSHGRYHSTNATYSYSSYYLCYQKDKRVKRGSRVLLEKLTGPRLVKKFPAFYGTGRFVTAFTRARHLSLS